MIRNYVRGRELQHTHGDHRVRKIYRIFKPYYVFFRDLATHFNSYQFLAWRGHILLESFPVENRKYHGYWCSGDARIHGIDQFLPTYMYYDLNTRRLQTYKYFYFQCVRWCVSSYMHLLIYKCCGDVCFGASEERIVVSTEPYFPSAYILNITQIFTKSVQINACLRHYSRVIHTASLSS